MPHRIKEEYKPHTEEEYLGYLIEECGEVMAAVGKSIRWGLESFNPEPGSNGEKNYKWIMREIKDLKRAIRFVENHIKSEY